MYRCMDAEHRAYKPGGAVGQSLLAPPYCNQYQLAGCLGNGMVPPVWHYEDKEGTVLLRSDLLKVASAQNNLLRVSERLL